LKLAIIFQLSLLLSLNAYAAENSFGERFKSKLKERWAKNQEAKPAPELTNLTTEKISKSGDYTFSLNHSGLTRYYRLHVPKNYIPNQPHPLLIAIHGGGGNMTIQSEDKYYKLISKSDEAGFIALFPNGYSNFKSGKIATWNAGKCCGQARDNKIDDVGFFKEMIKKVSQQLNIDSNKIFATGMSNGGMLAYQLACDLTDVIKAIAPVAGTDVTINCKPSKPISIIQFHAKNDDHVQFNGGIGKAAVEDELITNFPSVSETVNKWVVFNQCSPTPKRVLVVPGAYCDLYTNCKDKVEIKLCVTETGGHSWPGGSKIRLGKENNSKAISANDIMWDFFVSH
jgi:polyhydroxybutyrate depolymerase